jgi:DNA (cytosine-5)-methyltransferase 1
MTINELKKGPWNLTDLKNVKPNGLKVFSIFSCGGGSTMGYKLAGYEVIGCCEIDPQMMRIYRANHNPRLSYLMGVQEFKLVPDLERELFDLDILDGSPPCSSFSMAGSREKAWGDKKKFREGQAEQVLDNLFFDFIEVAKRLQPKIVVAENVKGLIQGNARGYVKEIFQGFKDAGYHCQLFLLNAAAMGVPQRRERTFFIANRLDKKIDLKFSENTVTIGDAWSDLSNQKGKELSDEQKKYWEKTPPGKSLAFAHPKGNMFTWVKVDPKRPCGTVVAGPAQLHYAEPRWLSSSETIRAQSFPDDYNFLDAETRYLCGMSVPPFMMQRVADQIYKQFFLEQI